MTLRDLFSAILDVPFGGNVLIGFVIGLVCYAVGKAWFEYQDLKHLGDRYMQERDKLKP